MKRLIGRGSSTAEQEFSAVLHIGERELNGAVLALSHILKFLQVQKRIYREARKDFHLTPPRELSLRARLSFFPLKKCRIFSDLIIKTSEILQAPIMIYALISVLGSVLVIFTIVLPMLRASELRSERNEEEFAEMYRLVQLSTIREWYPELSQKTLAEIRRNYDVSELYRDIR